MVPTKCALVVLYMLVLPQMFAKSNEIPKLNCYLYNSYLAILRGVPELSQWIQETGINLIILAAEAAYNAFSELKPDEIPILTTNHICSKEYEMIRQQGTDKTLDMLTEEIYTKVTLVEGDMETVTLENMHKLIVSQKLDASVAGQNNSAKVGNDQSHDTMAILNNGINAGYMALRALISYPADRAKDRMGIISCNLKMAIIKQYIMWLKKTPESAIPLKDLYATMDENNRNQFFFTRRTKLHLIFSLLRAKEAIKYSATHSSIHNSFILQEQSTKHAARIVNWNETVVGALTKGLLIMLTDIFNQLFQNHRFRKTGRDASGFSSYLPREILKKRNLAITEFMKLNEHMDHTETILSCDSKNSGQDSFELKLAERRLIFSLLVTALESTISIMNAYQISRNDYMDNIMIKAYLALHNLADIPELDDDHIDFIQVERIILLSADITLSNLIMANASSKLDDDEEQINNRIMNIYSGFQKFVNSILFHQITEKPQIVQSQNRTIMLKNMIGIVSHSFNELVDFLMESERMMSDLQSIKIKFLTSYAMTLASIVIDYTTQIKMHSRVMRLESHCTMLDHIDHANRLIDRLRIFSNGTAINKHKSAVGQRKRLISRININMLDLSNWALELNQMIEDEYHHH